jgi:hypothetical protein
MGSRAGLVGILVLVSVLGVGAPPAAWSRSGPSCTFSAIVTLEPGLRSTVESQGTFETAAGDEGTYQCRTYGLGKSTGQATGWGDYGTRDGDSCDGGGEGDGNIRLHDRRSSSTTHFTFTYSPFSDDGTALGEFRGDGFEGTFTLTALGEPEAPDCLVTPVTRVRLDGEGWLTR